MLLSSSREGYGMVVVEASAHATPSIVVAADDNAAVELIEDGVNGVIVTEPRPRRLPRRSCGCMRLGSPWRAYGALVCRER